MGPVAASFKIWTNESSGTTVDFCFALQQLLLLLVVVAVLLLLVVLLLVVVVVVPLQSGLPTKMYTFHKQALR